MSRRAPRVRPEAPSASRRCSHERQPGAALGIREIAESHRKPARVSSSNRARSPIESSARAAEDSASSWDPSQNAGGTRPPRPTVLAGCRRNPPATINRTWFQPQRIHGRLRFCRSGCRARDGGSEGCLFRNPSSADPASSRSSGFDSNWQSARIDRLASPDSTSMPNKPARQCGHPAFS